MFIVARGCLLSFCLKVCSVCVCKNILSASQGTYVFFSLLTLLVGYEHNLGLLRKRVNSEKWLFTVFVYDCAFAFVVCSTVLCLAIPWYWYSKRDYNCKFVDFENVWCGLSFSVQFFGFQLQWKCDWLSVIVIYGRMSASHWCCWHSSWFSEWVTFILSSHLLTDFTKWGNSVFNKSSCFMSAMEAEYLKTFAHQCYFICEVLTVRDLWLETRMLAFQYFVQFWVTAVTFELLQYYRYCQFCKISNNINDRDRFFVSYVKLLWTVA